VNALGTVNLLESTRLHCPEAVFILLSTNKVYGDVPNEIPLKELETRWEYARPDYNGITENCRIDRTLHSLFGASKASADLMAQEYGRYFGIRVCVFRGGCLTGPSHSGVKLHGFLSYLVKATLTGRTYSIFGYKGKQVRDNIHSYDVVCAMEEFAADPRPGEVYNMGGGRENSLSMLEAIDRVGRMTGKKLDWRYVDEARKGDHICYIPTCPNSALTTPIGASPAPSTLFWKKSLTLRAGCRRLLAAPDAFRKLERGRSRPSRVSCQPFVLSSYLRAGRMFSRISVLHAMLCFVYNRGVNSLGGHLGWPH
jgi:nucleoside-diphosphate-sugar epimerase